MQVIPQQYADIHQSTDLTKNNLHHRISYLYDDLLIKQDVPDKQAFVLILIILPVLSVVIMYILFDIALDPILFGPTPLGLHPFCLLLYPNWPTFVFRTYIIWSTVGLNASLVPGVSPT